MTTYNDATMSIDMSQVIPYCAIFFIVLAIFFVSFLTFKIDHLRITKVKKSFGICKFASLLAATLAAASFFFDFFRFVDQPAQFSAFRIIRLVVFIPFIAYLIINAIPKKIKRKRIVLPSWLKPICAVATLVWCILGLVMIYFWQSSAYETTMSTVNIFRIAFIFHYILVTLFFAFEIKFELLSPVPKAYVFFSGLLFTYSFTVIGPIMLRSILIESNNLGSISLFEIFLAFALGLYALSKLIAMQQTMRFVMKKNSGGSHHHHRSHRHHHSKSEGEAVVAESTEKATEKTEK